MPWAGGDLFTNPAANVVLADTGAFSPHDCDPLLVVWASTGIEVIFEHRDANNSVTLKDQILPCTLSLLVLALKHIAVARNERFRLLLRTALDGAVGGEVEASIFDV